MLAVRWALCPIDQERDTAKKIRMAAVIPALADQTAAAVSVGAADVSCPARVGQSILLAMPPVELAAQASDGAAWRASLATALAAHFVVLVAIGSPLSERMVGGGGTDLEAISVDVISALALDARDVAIPSLASAAPMAAVAATDGGEVAEAATVAIPDLSVERKPDEPAKAERSDIVIPDIVIKPEPPEPKLPGIVISPTKSEQVVDGPERPVPVDPKPDAAMQSGAPAEASQGQAIGGVGARGSSSAATPATAAALASPGELAVYERRLQQAIAKSPPRLSRANDNRGDVTIRFAVAPDGSLAYAQVDKSSGKSQLDDAALASVRRAQLPVPPAGQRPYYFMPFKFR